MKHKAVIFIICFFLVMPFIYQIKNVDHSKGLRVRTMDYDDIFGNIIITSPTSSDTLRTGKIFTIEWNVGGNIEHVTIALYKKSEFVELIVLTTKNDGEFDWLVGDFEDGDDYMIMIWDYNDFNVNDTSDYFQITSKIDIYFAITLLFMMFFSIGLGMIIILMYSRMKFKKKKIHN